MYYRHIYASIQGGPTLEQRFESYRNYVQLFNAILSAEKPLELELPIQWLWDIIDEFIYQVKILLTFHDNLASLSSIFDPKHPGFKFSDFFKKYVD